MKELDWVADDFDRTCYPVTAQPVPDLRFECPCCEYPTLGERGGGEICRLCGWEDDGQDHADAGRVLGGPNYELSLITARENFARYFEKHAPGSKRFRAPTNREVEAKRNIMVNFDALRRGPSDKARLWKKVVQGEQILKEELHHRVRRMSSKGKP
jgi:hypothetical protein